MAWIIRSLKEFDDGGVPLFWRNQDGWVLIQDADSFTDDEMETLNLPFDSEWQVDHRTHLITHNMRCIYTQTVLMVDDIGDVRLEPDGACEAIDETFLWCENCGERLMGIEIGANESWAAM
jgi:hypothetical protein